MEPTIITAGLTQTVRGADLTATASQDRLASPPDVSTSALLLGLLMIIFGSASDLISEVVLTGLACVVLPLSVRSLLTGGSPRWAGGLGLAVTATVLVHVLQTWSL